MAGVVTGLDMGTVMTIGAARDVDLELLSEVLPAVEAAILAGQADEAPDPGDDD
jgi:hypothetical protein